MCLRMVCHGHEKGVKGAARGGCGMLCIICYKQRRLALAYPGNKKRRTTRCSALLLQKYRRRYNRIPALKHTNADPERRRDSFHHQPLKVTLPELFKKVALEYVWSSMKQWRRAAMFYRKKGVSCTNLLSPLRV